MQHCSTDSDVAIRCRCQRRTNAAPTPRPLQVNRLGAPFAERLRAFRRAVRRYKPQADDKPERLRVMERSFSSPTEMHSKVKRSEAKRSEVQCSAVEQSEAKQGEVK